MSDEYSRGCYIMLNGHSHQLVINNLIATLSCEICMGRTSLSLDTLHTWLINALNWHPYVSGESLCYARGEAHLTHKYTWTETICLSRQTVCIVWFISTLTYQIFRITCRSLRLEKRVWDRDYHDPGFPLTHFFLCVNFDPSIWGLSSFQKKGH